MQRQRKSMHVARFLSGLPSSYDPILDPIFCPKGHVEPEAIGRIMIWSQGLRDFA